MHRSCWILLILPVDQHAGLPADCNWRRPPRFGTEDAGQQLCITRAESATKAALSPQSGSPFASTPFPCSCSWRGAGMTGGAGDRASAGVLWAAGPPAVDAPPAAADGPCLGGATRRMPIFVGAGPRGGS